MSDRAVLALAVAVCIGARLALPVPVWAAVVLSATALLLRRPWALVVAAGAPRRRPRGAGVGWV